MTENQIFAHFAQMYLSIGTGSSGEQYGPWSLVEIWKHTYVTRVNTLICVIVIALNTFSFSLLKKKKYLYYTSVYQKYILLVLKCRDKKTTTHTLTIDTCLTHILSISMVSSRGQVLRIQNRVIFFSE